MRATPVATSVATTGPSDASAGGATRISSFHVHLLPIPLIFLLFVHPAFASGEPPRPPEFSHVQHTEAYPGQILVTLAPAHGDHTPAEDFWFNLTLQRKIVVNPPAWTLDLEASGGSMS